MKREIEMSDFFIKFGQFARVLGIILICFSACEFWKTHFFFLTNWNAILFSLLTSGLLMYRKNHYRHSLCFWLIAVVLTFIWMGSYERMHTVGKLFIGFPVFLFSFVIYQILLDIDDNMFDNK